MNKKARRSKSARSGVLFSVSRLHRYLKHRCPKFRVSAVAPVYQAAVLEYLTAEIIELSGNAARDYKKSRITPRHILLAISNDLELNQLLKFVTIPSGGVLPKILPALIKKNPVASLLNSKEETKDVDKINSPKKRKKVSADVQNNIILRKTFLKKKIKFGKRKKAGKKVKKLTPGKSDAKFSIAKVAIKLDKGFTILSEKKLILGQMLTVIQGDISAIATDAIVHPTNSSLSLYGQIGNHLEKIGGEKFVDLINEYKKYVGNLAVNGVAVTKGINFSSSWVIHVNSPHWKRTKNPREDLEEVVLNLLVCAHQQKFTSLAIPSIGSGSGGYPKQMAAEVILRTLNEYFKKPLLNSTLKKIYFVLYDKQSIEVYLSELGKI